MEALPIVLFLLAIAAGTVTWIWVAVDIARTDESAIRVASKTTWLVVVILGHLPAALLYLALARPRSRPRPA